MNVLGVLKAFDQVRSKALAKPEMALILYMLPKVPKNNCLSIPDAVSAIELLFLRHPVLRGLSACQTWALIHSRLSSTYSKRPHTRITIKVAFSGLIRMAEK